MTQCWAPSLQLHLSPNGDARVCCHSLVTLGNLARSSLAELWTGALRQDTESRLAIDDFSLGCENCEAQIALEGRRGSIPAEFDHWVEILGRPPSSPRWPVRIEFELSNACNLQCVQCNGEHSSAIRIHRERRAPLRSPYGDEFFEELAEFLPHLRQASFAGGEPFLSPETFRVWEDLARLRPGMSCSVLTNATQWSPRIERILDSLRFDVVFSIDGATAATYESIRIGADFGEVLENVERYLAYTRRVGTSASLNFCLMPQNIHELPDVLRFAEARGMAVNVMVVRSPVQHSISRLPDDELRAHYDRLLSESASMERSLVINGGVWRAELNRMASWLDRSSDGDTNAWAREGKTILGFRRTGTGACDEGPARSELAAWCGGSVHSMDVGPDDLIGRAEPGAAAALGLAVSDLVGRNPQFLLGVIEQAVVGTASETRQELSGSIGGQEIRVVAVPRRDDSGWADSAALLLAVRTA